MDERHSSQSVALVSVTLRIMIMISTYVKWTNSYARSERNVEYYRSVYGICAASPFIGNSQGIVFWSFLFAGKWTLLNFNSHNIHLCANKISGTHSIWRNIFCLISKIIFMNENLMFMCVWAHARPTLRRMNLWWKRCFLMKLSKLRFN